MASGVETALARHRAISIVALAGLTLIAWAWLLAGAGMDANPFGALAPHAVSRSPMAGMTGAGMPPHAPMAWSAGRFGLTLAMWWVMMMAMMLPSAAPTILLYARAASRGAAPTRPATEGFLVGYLLVWGAFSLLATGLHMLFERIDLLAQMSMAVHNRWLSSAILLAAGLYQISPLKSVCLRHCRNPAAFLSRHYRPGVVGALRMGVLHGAYCVGCCWLLMALLFVVGVMNLAWIAALTLVVASEKLLPHGRVLSLAVGLGCIGWAVVRLIG